MARVRRNVWNLPPGDQTLVWYGRAIEAMQRRPITDPTSWPLQGAIHDYDRASDPLAVRGEALPSTRVRNRFWRQCQHGSWFFLPWHRMYLHVFEEIVAADVVRLGGPADWALPYWDYSASLQSRLLPPAFRSPTLPGGGRNYLYVRERDPAANAGQQFADSTDVAVRVALAQARFSNPSQGNFGGLPSSFSHSGPGPGQVERTPHGTMHVAVGGQSGWMGAFATAALDPIFWLHHANVDRLWDVWVRRDPAHQNPTSLQWLSMIPFSFAGPGGRVITMRCADVVDTAALGYSYEDVSDPLADAGPGPILGSAESPREVPMANPPPPELVGATEGSFKVQNAPVHVQIPTPFQADARVRLGGGADGGGEAAEPRVLLQLENLTARGRANSYDVYVNIPEGDDPAQHPDQLAGRLDLFGIAEVSRATSQHPGSGLTYTFDISAIYQGLSSQPGWDPQNIRVSLVPVRQWEGAAVTVGRVSLFFG